MRSALRCILAVVVLALLPAAATAQSAALVPRRDTISVEAYQGWKQYEVNCARCHGEYGIGSTYAPSLVQSLKDGGPVPDQATFISVVCNGRKDKGMPAWCALDMEMTTMLRMYEYLKLRADGKVIAFRPVPQPAD